MTTTPQSKQLAKHRKLWIECLRGDDYNSIRNQLQRMVWNAAAYRTINEARGLLPEAQEGGVQANGMMHDLIDRCFWDSQLFAVRRLSDSSSLRANSTRKDDSVYSLIALLRDMKKQAALFTRENIFSVEELEYDIAKIENEDSAYALKLEEEGRIASYTPPEIDTLLPDLRHSAIDQLSGTTADSRSPADRIPSWVFENLERRVKDPCEKIVEFVNKFRAHAATPGSRSEVDADDIKLSLADLFEAHETLCRTAATIEHYLLGTGGGAYLAYPQYDHLDYIDRPLAKSNDVDSLYDFWQGLHSESESWEPWTVEELGSKPQRGL